jgi:hypothetical protein
MLMLIAGLFFATFTLLGQQTQLPITSYDYALPENNVSPITMGTGAFNLINADDPYAAYANPALMADNQLSSFSLSFRLKNEDDLAFWEAVNISNALKSKQFKYFVLNTKQVSFAYQPVAGVHISEFSASGDSSRYYDYQLDKVQFSIGAKDKKYQKLGAGLSVKYLSGRLVYLNEHKLGSMMVRDGFIDDKVKGVSTDLGFTYTVGNMVYAGSFYDLLSRLWWENMTPYPCNAAPLWAWAGQVATAIFQQECKARYPKIPILPIIWDMVINGVSPKASKAPTVRVWTSGWVFIAKTFMARTT